MSLALRTEGLTARYGEAAVLHGIDIDIRPCRITAVVGANGAGKTSLMKALAGVLPVSDGRILCDGRDIAAVPPHERVAGGIVLVPEGRLIFPDMTVRENLAVGAISPPARPLRDRTMADVFDLFPRLRERSGQLGGTLSGGEQQMLALGRGLMARPKLLLLDEPTLGLAPAVAKQIFQVIPGLVDRGLTVVLAEQDVSRTLRIADRAIVLQHGLVTAEGTGEEILADPELRHAFLGRATSA